MKKLKKIIFLIIISITFNVKALTCNKTYLVQTVNSDGMNDYIACTDSYEEALNLMREYPSTKSKVATINKAGNIVNAKYAVVNFADKATTNPIIKPKTPLLTIQLIHKP